MLPVDETIQFNLHSPDVIHSFWVPGFLFKMDVIPGRDNHFELTPTASGTFAGKCAELCGVYHSRMLFNVKVVSEDEYDSYLAGPRRPQGNTSEPPLLGGADADTQAGLESDDPTEARSDRDSRTARRTVDRPQDRWASRSSGSSPPPTTS